MERKGIPQEALKILACITMLIDHVGATMYPGNTTLRIIGRIAFPIYCFLLAEGVHYTKSPAKYALRLAIGVLLAEIPFDLALKYKFTWEHQSVMVTLLMGFVAVELIEMTEIDILKLAIAAVFSFGAQYFHTDYGGWGVLLVIMFSQTRGNFWMQTVMLFAIAAAMNSARIMVFGRRVAIELFAVAAMIPIGLYSGKKVTSSKFVQWGFFLFYPVHLTVLYLIRILR